jgi:hypothetical protein
VWKFRKLELAIGKRRKEEAAIYVGIVSEI